MPQYVACECVESAHRNCVARKSRSRRGCRVKNGLRKYPLPLRERRHYAETCDAGPQSRALPVCEEERLVRLDWPAKREPILIPAEFRRWARLCEQVPGVERLIAKELEDRAMELIAARLADHH